MALGSVDQDTLYQVTEIYHEEISRNHYVITIGYIIDSRAVRRAGYAPDAPAQQLAKTPYSL